MNIDFYKFLIALLLSISCTSQFHVIQEFETENYHNRKVEYNFKINGNKYELTKLNGPYVFNTNRGLIINVGKDLYKLVSLFPIDSILYPVVYEKKKECELFTIELPMKYSFNRLFINDSLCVDTTFKPMVNPPKRIILKLKYRPKTLHFESNLYSDWLFGTNQVRNISVKYILPDSINYMSISDVSDYDISIRKFELFYNKKLRIICSNGDTLNLSKKLIIAKAKNN